MDDNKPEEKVVDKPVDKSWSQIRKEARDVQREKAIKKLTKQIKVEEPKNDTSDTSDTKTETPKEEDKPEPKVEEPKEPKIDVEAITRKVAEETASKVSTETRKAFDEKVQEILDKDKSLVDKQKELDELIPVYLKENRLPTDYKEMVDEQLRVTEAKWAQLEREKASKTKAEPEAPKVDNEQERLANFHKGIVDDLRSLSQSNELRLPEKIEEIDNLQTTDPNAKNIQKIFDFGIELNKRINAHGGTALTSLKSIYEVYKMSGAAMEVKTKQPAGADAPVSPSRNQSVTQPNAPTPFYQKGPDGKMRPKSWAQIKYEGLKRLTNR